MEFDQPLEIHAVPTEEPLVFATIEAFDEWIAQQVTAWGKLYQELHPGAQASSLRRVLDRQYYGWKEMRSGELQVVNKHVDRVKSEQRDIGELVNRRLADGQLICGTHPMIARAAALVERDREVAEYLVMIASGDIRHELNDLEGLGYRLGIYARAIAALSETGSLTKLVSDISASLLRANAMVLQVSVDHREIRSFADRKIKVLSRASRKAVGAASRQRQEIGAEWERLRASYDTSLKLRAPRQYWETKLEEHQRLSKQWSKWFARIGLSGLAVAGVMLLLLSNIWEAQSANLGAIAWILPATILGIPLFLVLWLLRMCGRQWSDHVMRQEDARERVVMIETFLALSRDADSPNTIVDPGHLAIVLNAVFRPGPGFASDDSPPTGVIDAALARLGSQKSG